MGRKRWSRVMSDKFPTKSNRSRPGISRRAALRGAAMVTASAVLSPMVLRAQSGGKVFVRTSGGSYQDALKAGTWDEFTSKTGIEVVPVPANTAKLLAMAQMNTSEVDLVDANASTILTLEENNLLDPIEPSRFKLTNPKDLSVVGQHYVAYSAFAEALIYNTEAFPGRHPRSWAEFWDVKTFPGRRTLQDAKAISPDLEFALLADGVPMDKLYPLDIERAFAKMKEIRPNIIKFYDTGALGASLFADKTVVLGSLWTNRAEVLRQGGAPVAVEWNQAMRSSELTAVFRNAPNKDNAYRLLDYSMSPGAQAKTLPKIGLSPSNAGAFELIDSKIAATLPTAPTNKALGFDQDASWWLKNRDKVAQRWEEFILG
jgi:putative spermidine/putrescine transport system substrate-binding protein